MGLHAFIPTAVCLFAFVVGLVKASNESSGRECGIIVHVHVGKTGGTTVLHHFQRRRYVREFIALGGCKGAGENKYSYEDQWQALDGVVQDMSTATPFTTRVPTRANKLRPHLDKWTIGPPASDPQSPWWTFVHTHTCSPGLLWSFKRLMAMKKKVETSGSGCKMVLTTTVREPESRFWSNYFYQAKTGKAGFEIPDSKAAKEKHVVDIITEHPNPQSTILAFNCDLISNPTRPNCSANASQIARVSHT